MFAQQHTTIGNAVCPVADAANCMLNTVLLLSDAYFCHCESTLAHLPGAELLLAEDLNLMMQVLCHTQACPEARAGPCIPCLVCLA